MGSKSHDWVWLPKSRTLEWMAWQKETPLVDNRLVKNGMHTSGEISTILRSDLVLYNVIGSGKDFKYI